VNLQLTLRSRFGAFALDARFGAPSGITALFGPSGAGKTLTLRCIAGLERVEAGRIVLGERVLLDTEARVSVPTRARRIGYVFQQYALFPHLDVAANVGYGIRDRPRGERERRVAELLALVNLAGYGDRSPLGLSGGEQQRVALARALATDPGLLLLDEPFAALDQRVRRRLRTELRRVHEVTGTPMLLVTHDLAEVRQLADWIVLYNRGRVLQCGAAAEVLDGPVSDEAAEVLHGEHP
jgi:molybdate transport system ATP-binding protein